MRKPYSKRNYFGLKIPKGWIELGDLNTKIRRDRNKINTLQDVNGTWITKPQLLNIIANNYFQQLFKRIPSCDTYQAQKKLLSEYTKELLRRFQTSLTAEEIKITIFNMNQAKAARVDGTISSSTKKHGIYLEATYVTLRISFSALVFYLKVQMKPSLPSFRRSIIQKNNPTPTHQVMQC